MSAQSRNDEQAKSLATTVCAAETVEALSSARRRRIVVTLLERNGPLSVDDLTSAVVESEESDSPSTEREATVTLYHVDLPVLEAADLVTVDEDGFVELGPHPDLRRGPLTALLLQATEQGLWSAFDVLRDPVRSAIVKVLDAHESTVTVDDLAQHLDSESVPADATADLNAEDLELTLRHVHLPKLDAVGLVRYDDADDTVTPKPRRWI